MKHLSALALSLLLCATAQAKPEPYTGPDYSGTYACTGKDDHEGDYTGTVTMELVRAQSTGVYGAYKFKLEVPGYGAYLGQAAARGKDVAIHFALTDQSTKDYGTAIASFTKNKAGKWSFSKYYFEPEFKGGNFGMERCVQQ